MTERHNERKNESYHNPDICLERSTRNIHFKHPTDTYLHIFDNLCKDGTISTRGLKPTATIIDELIFDVNSAYFEERGGYDFAADFYRKAYAFAVQETGGEQYILSAVMHADERNKALSEQLGHDVYHYHLHVVYIPTVQKKILWSKRCKDKSLVGTVKETVTQVSHSKKWASRKQVDSNGKTTLIRSYSLLQDRFFAHMMAAGFRDIERGKRGSTTAHLTDLEYKVAQEQSRLADIAQQVVQMDTKAKSTTEAIVHAQKQQVKLASVDNIAETPAFLDKSKVVVNTVEFHKIKKLAKKQIASEGMEKKQNKEIAQLRTENQALTQTVEKQKAELSQFKSMSNRLSTANLQIECDYWHDIVNKMLVLAERLGFIKQFKNIINQHKREEKER